MIAPAPDPPLAPWADFYVIVGTAGATLTGLMSVVVTLTAQVGQTRRPAVVSAFGTPNVVHFLSSLVVAGTLAAPWRTLTTPGAVLGVYGVAGMAYAAFIAWRAARQHDYQPVLEDWLFHVVLPAAAYGTLAAAGLALRRGAEWAPFGAAAVTLVLLVAGVHNAWDALTYVSTEQGGGPSGK